MRFVSKHKIMIVGILAFCLTMIVGGAMFAQTPNDQNTQTPTDQSAQNPTPTDQNTRTDNDHDYSWIGLLGLAGLAGLAGRKRDHVVRHEETGMPRTAAR
jgi:MYXO-CTERM domain-containing protein